MPLSTTDGTAVPGAPGRIAADDASERAVVRDASERAAVKDASERAAVKDASERAAVKDASGRAAVKDASGRAAVKDASGRAAVPDTVHDALLRELAARPGGTWVTCAGNSMEPTIRRGERVRVAACTRVRSGEVALFTAQRGGYVLHRVVLAVPGTGWFVHIGDAGSGDGPGLAHVSRLVGRALVPRRRPSLPVWAAAVQRIARAAVRVTWRRR